MKSCLITACVALILSAPLGRVCAQQRPPNIIYILADDLGYGDLGCYGQKNVQTPSLDRMASEGIRFTDHYAGGPLCVPSRKSLMTGLHQGHHKNVWDNPTVADILKTRGYQTAVIGKWGYEQEGTPEKVGFDYSYGYLNHTHAHNYYPEFLIRNGKKVMLRNVVPNAKRNGAGKASVKVDYTHDLFTEDALKYITAQKNTPFFLYLCYTIPHANNEAGSDGMEVPSDAPYSDKNWPQSAKNFAAMVTRMDRDVGRILNHLKELGLDENTIVLFSSDNGPHREGGNDPEFHDSNGPLRGIKRNVYEGGPRVPFIVRWPGKIKPGRTSAHPSAFWDFLPTAAELAGAKAPAVDGISFLPELLGNPQPEHEYLYWQFTGRANSKAKPQFQEAVRSGKWKGYREAPEKPLELYDLDTDIGETKDVSRKHPDVVQRIQGYMSDAKASR